ncbi:unnamed protein product [Durusdinium trenchii]|uniref:Uncharacterized protein n=2 Tax=Durusdinium trenchii TaxID=1381693 RepID=A0ABP0KUT7_9DINO
MPKQPPVSRYGSGRRICWADPHALQNLCLLTMEDRRTGSRKRTGLPPYIYSDVIAPFLQFNSPMPGQLYAIGGRCNISQEPLNTVEMFDTWHGRWIQCPPMQERRAGCGASCLPGGSILVAGGYDERGIISGVLDSCEIFDPAKQEWRMGKARLQKARWGHGCAFLAGRVFCVGGCTPDDSSLEDHMETLRNCESYDPRTEKWHSFPALRIARAGARVVAVDERHLAAVGGCEDVFGHAQMLDTVELVNVHQGSWVLLNSQLRVPRTTAAVAALDDNFVFVMGGAPALCSAELFSVFGKSPNEGRDIDTRHVVSLTEGRMGCQAACLHLPSPGKTFPVCDRQCVLVVGGEDGTDDEPERITRQFATVLVYDVADWRWSKEGRVPDLPTPRTAMSLCVAPGLVDGTTRASRSEKSCA